QRAEEAGKMRRSPEATNHPGQRMMKIVWRIVNVDADLVMQRMTAAVGWMAQRYDLQIERGAFEPQQLLGNESFREARIALESNDNFVCHQRGSVGALDEREARMRTPVKQLGNLIGDLVKPVERQSGHGARGRCAIGQCDE